MFLRTLVLIAACLCEEVFVPIDPNADDESIVYIKKGETAEGCLATFAKPCPTLALALTKLVAGKAKHIIKYLKVDTDYDFGGMAFGGTTTKFFFQGAKSETEDEVVTLVFPAENEGVCFAYKAETEIKSLKIMCPPKMDKENAALISSTDGCLGLTLTSLVFELKAATTGSNAATLAYTLMVVTGKLTINKVEFTASTTWSVKNGLIITTADACTVKDLKITNVTVPDQALSVVTVITTKDFTIEGSSFTNCIASKSEGCGALTIVTDKVKDPLITFKSTTFTGCTAPLGAAGALVVAHHGTEAKLVFTGEDALAFTGCKKGSGDKEVATAAAFQFLETTSNLETFAKKITDSFGKSYTKENSKNLIIAKIGEKGDEVDLSKYFPEPPKTDAAFGLKINMALIFVALAAVVTLL